MQQKHKYVKADTWICLSYLNGDADYELRPI
jgi:tellurite resistance-related uncharacterized protein